MYKLRTSYAVDDDISHCQENSIRTNSRTVGKQSTVQHKNRSMRRTYRRLFRKFKSRIIRYSVVGANVAVLVAVIAFVTNNSESGSAVRSSAALGTAQAAAAPLDQLSSADIAVNAARLTALPESVAITNQADSEATQLAITATESRVIAKPQVVATSLKSAKDIKVYIAVDGDTISGLAAKFGVTSDSIRWSNGLSAERIPAGKELLIPPVSGVVIVVKAGDTADSLAQRYSSSKEQILADNDAEFTGLKVGQRVLIRGGVQPVARTAAVTSYSFFGGAASYGYNGYDYGYCTWYVANKRLAAGRPMPTNLGNAATWAIRAAAYGLSTGRTPQVGAAVVTATRGAGHVALVERINEDGSIWISEMNSRGQVSIDNTAPAGGWGRTNFKLVPAGTANSYSYVY